jgi:hypothetical protein
MLTPAARSVAVLLILVGLEGAALAQPYRWVDEQGEVHVTDDPNRIPLPLRPRAEPPRADSPPPAVAPSPPPRSADPGRRDGSGRQRVTLWLRTGGLQGEREPILIRVFDGEEACRAERDRRTAAHVSQGMQRTSQPGLATSNLGGTPAGETYFAYRCVPTGIRP